MSTIQPPAHSSLHPAHGGVHRHTDACFWDVLDARWRCPGRAAGDDRLLRLPRALVEPRRRPPSPVTPVPADRPVRLHAYPGVDDGC